MKNKAEVSNRWEDYFEGLLNFRKDKKEMVSSLELKDVRNARSGCEITSKENVNSACNNIKGRKTM